ncbi:MAG: SH3 domain-containing protein, partial [Treponema sp.]|nr:SH3 domain-containing protein [Candidatus Treponema equi]
EYLRISAPPRIPVVDATINDNDVRLRTKPDLKSDTWAKLGKGTKCKVKDKSKEELEIDGEKWYWYCIDAEGYPDGWVYGKYLDF